MRLLHVAGARPNFMKVAPVMRAARARGLEQILVHTGQHYDAAMSDVFFGDLALPKPDHYLGVGSGSHGEQTARVMMAIEPVLVETRPDWLVVYGDVNSTIAAALTAAKLGIRIAHVEAGLRSFDKSMPEETNRVLTDALSDLLLTPSVDGDQNLLAEGRPRSAIRCVGNVMIDTLDASLESARRRDVHARIGVRRGEYAVLTLHRPGNVDDPASLGALLDMITDVAARLPIVFPVHPRTKSKLAAARPLPSSVHLCEPLGYLDFLALLDGARVALTDSGGVQEETTALGVPCLTMRPNTERPVTITVGTNRLVGSDRGKLMQGIDDVLSGAFVKGARPPLWDGHASERIVDAFLASAEHADAPVAAAVG